MPQLQPAILEGLLKQQRSGITVRAYLNSRTYQRFALLKQRSGRSSHDILWFILSFYRHLRRIFDGDIPVRKSHMTVNIRISRRLANDATDWAWDRGVRRPWFLGYLIEAFLGMYKIPTLAKTLRNQRDRVERIIGGKNGRRKIRKATIRPTEGNVPMQGM